MPDDDSPPSPVFHFPLGTPAEPVTTVVPFAASSYIFRLKSYDILNTRSRHEDTNYVTVGTLVDGVSQSKTVKMGDQNNGHFSPPIHLDPVRVERPDAQIIFSYLIVNSGHDDEEKTRKGLTDALNVAMSKGVEMAGATLGTAIGGPVGGVVGDLLGQVLSFLGGKGRDLVFANCDGPVAFEQVAFTGEDLWRLTQQGHGFERVTDHPGTDSAAGCGSNSHYSVRWSVTR